MASSIIRYGDFMNGALCAIATIPPILLVIAAGTLPEGLGRGQLVVHGCAVNVAVVAAALILRASYALGFNKALTIAGSAESNESVAGGLEAS